jgi:hypothetical protein
VLCPSAVIANIRTAEAKDIGVCVIQVSLLFQLKQEFRRSLPADVL